MTTPEAIAGHEQDASTATGAGPLNTQLADLDRKIAALILAIESGADLPELTDQLKRRASERAGIQAQIRRLSKDRRLSGDEIQEAIGEPGA